MTDILDIDADHPSIRSLVRFRNSDRPFLVIRDDKAASDAKVFREAASMLPASDRSKVVAEWLNDLAAKYDRMENPQAEQVKTEQPAPVEQPQP